ncbi:hypothetical protein [Haloarchaeobius amylolyticus]|uniref:hypothetical protein n=1 Tax=Haloarchaeobius amylolyticus TaxID=1198296 RepID=UPI002270473C|nr:hypothetical protein [Haloarchaeobius amylolyticus]
MSNPDGRQSRRGETEAGNTEELANGGTAEPKSVTTRCANCETPGATALIPRDSSISECNETADGKVWGNCESCGERFDVYFEKN